MSGVGFAGLAVAALVVEDHSHVRPPLLAEPAALKVEGAHAQTESVDEDHGQLRVDRSGFADRQWHPVGRRDDVAAIVVHKIEILIGIRIFVGGGAVGH